MPWSQVLFGTDYPYVPAAPQRAALAANLRSARDLEYVEWRNAARLLGI